jgi:hypothetical protein
MEIVTFTGADEPAAEDAIAAFERDLGRRLPAAFRAFLSGQNGGQPSPNQLRLRGPDRIERAVTVTRLFGLCPFDPPSDLRERYRAAGGTLPGAVLPIGECADGALLLLGLERKREGWRGVYYWGAGWWPIRVIGNFDKFIPLLASGAGRG